MGIGELVFLRHLTYKVGENVINETERNETGIEELANLNNLERLFIIGFEKVQDPKNEERANLKEKQKLRVLELCWTGIGEEEEEEDWIHFEELGIRISRWFLNNFLAIEELQPPTSLSRLHIYDFMGPDLPTWMSVPSCLQNLEILWLVGCKNIIQLTAGIGQLPRLRCLKLSTMRLKSLDIGEFPSLTSILLSDMPFLEELGYYHCLQDLMISGCKRLTEIPSFPSLTNLELGNNISQNFVCSVGRSLTSLTTLFLDNIDRLVFFP